MKSNDFNLLVADLAREGLTHQRLEAVVASAGAYVGGTMGGKAKPTDLLPTVRRVLEWDAGGKEIVRGFFEALKTQHQRRGGGKDC